MTSLFLSNQQLRLCEQLKYLGLAQSFEIGTQLGRGFADLGFEQFVVLPGEQLLSLFTGHKSQVGDKKEDFFFLVPAVDDLLRYLSERGCQVSQLGSDADHSWHIELRVNGQTVANQASSLWQVLLEVCLQVGEQVQHASFN